MSDSTIAVTIRGPRLARWVAPGSFFRRLTARRLPAISLVIVAVFLVAALLAPLIAPQDPLKIDFYGANEGFWTRTPTGLHILGTDNTGRDTLSRLLFGARISIQVGFVAVGIGMAAGMTLGLVAGFRGGLLGEVIMRIMDGMMVFPGLLLALAIASALGPSITNVFFALGIVSVPVYARIMRGQVLSIRETDYVLAAHAIGAKRIRISIVHIFPNSLAPLIVQGTLAFGRAIIAEAGLSFLGVGIQPPDPSWGVMLSDAKGYLEQNPIQAIAPGLSIFVVVLAINLLGDGLREALDPRLRGTGTIKPSG
ncbi:MAG: ABC transporter permease [Chloroflexi bacterium]|nr:ABC transporter permease [Chloroflexota bacterium]